MTTRPGSLYYRDLIVWQKSLLLAKEAYRLARFLPKEETYGMRSQLTRAAVSVSANIAEGWARESMNETRQFLSIAHGSLAEVDTYLVICVDLGWFPLEETEAIHSTMTEVSKMLTALRRSTRSAH